MTCPAVCASCCCCCYTNGDFCGCLKVKSAKSFPTIEYYTPEKAKEKVEKSDTSFHDVPLQKIFDFPQPEAQDLGTHPQVTRGSIPVIREQPYGQELQEPMFVTKKGRSHTFSQLPDEGSDSRSDYGTPEPPFTPPNEIPSQRVITATPDLPLDIEDPAIQFSLYYDIQRRTLSVHLYQALSLPVRRDARSHDPFIVIFLLPTREVIHQTVTLANNRNPKYKQIFEFGGILAEEVYQQVLVFQVFYSDRFVRDQLIGSLLVPLKEADLYGIVMTKTIGEGQELLKVCVSLLHIHLSVCLCTLFGKLHIVLPRLFLALYYTVRTPKV